MDFLPGLVASKVGVFITELGQQTHCVLYLSFIFLFLFLFVLDVETLTETCKRLNIVHNILKQDALEFQLASEQAPCLF